MIQLVKDYQALVEKIPQLLAETHYKTGYIISELGITKPTFYRKLRKGTWTTDEVMKLIQFVNPKAYYIYQFERELELAEKDLENGDIVENAKALDTIQKRLTK
jgi:hypothetical protein